MRGKERYIPGIDPAKKIRLPEGYANSLVDAGGYVQENHYNFDERIDDDEEDDLASEAGKFDPEQAEKERQKKIEELKKAEKE